MSSIFCWSVQRIDIRISILPKYYCSWPTKQKFLKLLKASKTGILKKKNYNMIHHVIIGGFIDVYIVVRFVWF